MQIKIVERERQIELQQQEILRREKELEATIMKPVSDIKYSIESRLPIYSLPYIHHRLMLKNTNKKNWPRPKSRKRFLRLKQKPKQSASGIYIPRSISSVQVKGARQKLLQLKKEQKLKPSKCVKKLKRGKCIKMLQWSIWSSS